MKKRPNILFFIADDHRFDALGCNGDVTVQTPTFDALAKSGANLQCTFMMGGLTGAVCVPARAMLHTGRGTFHTSVANDMNQYSALMTLKPENITLGQTLREAGYHTHGIGKWHNDKAAFNRSFADGSAIFFGGMYDQWRTPVQNYDPTGEYLQPQEGDGTHHSTDVFCDAAIDFLGDYKEEEPFFLYVAFTSPHDPRDAPEPFASQYEPDDMPLPPNFMAEHPFDNGNLDGRDEELAAFPRTPHEIQQHTADYYAMISHMDARIGDVLQTLQARGFDDNTIVVYTADHGLGVGRHGLMGKQNLYDHSVRVPLLLRGPNVPQGQNIESLCYTFDLYATLCKMAGASAPDGIESQSLLPLLGGETTEHRVGVGAVYCDIQRMWSDGEWKIIRYYRGKNGDGQNRVQLFHVSEDPHELQDLSREPEQVERVQEMLKNLSEWQRENGDFLQ